jgi:hypothetical protein
MTTPRSMDRMLSEQIGLWSIEWRAARIAHSVALTTWSLTTSGGSWDALPDPFAVIVTPVTKSACRSAPGCGRFPHQLPPMGTEQDVRL